MGKGSALLRDKRTWWAAGTVVLLAAVIMVASALSAPKRENASDKITPSIRAEALAKQAETALSEGETSTAQSLAEEALKVDPRNAAALKVVERIQSPSPIPANNGAKPSGGSGDKPKDSEETPPTAAPDGVYAEQVDDITALLPASIKGWSKGTVVHEGTEATVIFSPDPGTEAVRSVNKALVIVHDRGSKAKAKEFVSKVTGGLYSRDTADVRVGVVDARFGTDGARLATVSFARGRYAFEVIVTARPNTKPSSLKNTSVMTASTLPAAK